MTSSTKLPSHVTTLQALLQGSEERNGRKDDRIERLEKLVADFKRALFGSKSEKVPTGQYELALEDIEAAIAAIHTEDEQDASPLVNPKEPRRSNRGSFPQHLPCVEEGIAPDNIICDCARERHIIGEDDSERLDIVPSPFRVLVTRGPKYAFRACENGIIQGETFSAIGPRAMVARKATPDRRWHVPPHGRVLRSNVPRVNRSHLDNNCYQQARPLRDIATQYSVPLPVNTCKACLRGDRGSFAAVSTGRYFCAPRCESGQTNTGKMARSRRL
jgi:hypothetical protein